MLYNEVLFRFTNELLDHGYFSRYQDIFILLRNISDIVNNCFDVGYINASIKVKLIKFLLKPQQIIKQDR